MTGLRKIKSFVRRDGRLTAGQSAALEQGWQRYGLDNPDNTTLDLKALFPKTAPVVLEIGFGNGVSLYSQLQTNPQLNFLGIEVYRSGVGRLLRDAGLIDANNLRVICHDAVVVLTDWFPENTIDIVQIYFPDPWPKKRHHKRRLIQKPFLALLARVLKPGGAVCIATDWQPYAEHIAEVVAESPQFQSKSFEEIPAIQSLKRPMTKFEKKGIEAEREIHNFYLVSVAAS